MEIEVYIRNGYKSRAEYLKSVAGEFSVPLDIVFYLSEILGPEEDFDGLLNELEDLEDRFYD